MGYVMKMNRKLVMRRIEEVGGFFIFNALHNMFFFLFPPLLETYLKKNLMLGLLVN